MRTISAIDVVVPCYNYAHFLGRCVESVLSQRGVDVRVLIIDDASRDETPKWGERLASLDPRVEFRRHDINRGHICTYNEGLIGWASSEYSLLLSADDALAPGALDRATSLMNDYRDVGFTYGMALIVGDEDTAGPPASGDSPEFRIVSGPKFLKHCCISGNPVPTPTAVVRTKLQQRLGGYRADLPHTADMEMWMRFAVHAPVGVLRAIQGYYRLHDWNMSSRYYADLLSDQRERFRACSDVIAHCGAQFPESEYWLDTASRALGEEAFWLANRAFDNGDIDAYRAGLQFAKEHYPNLSHTSIWWRHQAKRLLGPGLWRRVRPALSYVRFREQRSSPDRKTVSRFQPGQLNGWWPDAC